MRCATHPDRIAHRACTLCGTHHCDDCLTDVHGEPHCTTCAEAARRVDAPSPAPVAPVAERRRRAVQVAGAVVVAGMATALILLALRRPEPAPPRTWVEPDERDTRAAACFGELERAAIAIETYRAERGAVPDRWATMVPDLLDEAPTDPWAVDDAPLRLAVPRWDPDAVLLYSVGPDRRDDGGRAFSPETGIGDVVYVVR